MGRIDGGGCEPLLFVTCYLYKHVSILVSKETLYVLLNSAGAVCAVKV